MQTDGIKSGYLLSLSQKVVPTISSLRLQILIKVEQIQNDSIILEAKLKLSLCQQALHDHVCFMQKYFLGTKMFMQLLVVKLLYQCNLS